MMKEPNKIDRLLTGKQIPVGDRTIQPVAHLSGWIGGNGGPHGVGGGGWVRVRPVAVIVREADGTESRVPVVDAGTQAIRGIVMAGLMVAGVCVAIMVIRRLTNKISTQEKNRWNSI
jgi:uncharacterized spore protein YtfJ